MDENDTQPRTTPPARIGPHVRPPAIVFGTAISDLTLTESLGAIDHLVRDGRRHGRTHQVCTVNVDFLVNSLDDDRVAGILRRASLNLPDGMPVVWASRLLGAPLRERVAGADLVPLLIAESADREWHVHLFGSSPDVAHRAAAELRARFPTSSFSIEPGPSIADPTDVPDGILDGIIAVEADVLCVALGHPKQELFIDAHRDRLGVPVMIGVGGSIDMIVGEQPRAPSWLQRSGLEWLWRAGTDPSRLAPRYAHDARVFGPALAREWWRQRRTDRPPTGLRIHVRDDSIDASVDGARPLQDASYQWAVEQLESGQKLRLLTAAPLAGTALRQLVGLIAAARRGGGVSGMTTVADMAATLHVPPELIAFDSDT